MLLLGGATIAAIGTAGYRMFQSNGVIPEDLETLYAEAESYGMPMTAADLDPPTPIPADQNAAAEFLAAAEELSKVIGSDELHIMIHSGEAPKIAVAREKLAKATDALARAEKASHLPHCRYERDWDMAHALDFSEHDNTVFLALRFTDRAVLHAYDGNMEAAVKDLQTALRIGRLQGQEPQMNSLQCRVYSEWAVERAVIQCATFASQDDDLKLLRTVMEDGREKIQLSDYVFYDFYSGVAAARNLKRFGGTEGIADYAVNESVPLVTEGLPEDKLARSYLRRHLELWRPFWEIKPYWDDNDYVFDVLYELEDTLYASGREENAMMLALNPDFWTPATYIFRVETENIMVSAMLDVLAYRNKNGHLPSTLEDAGFAEIDPLTGVPYRYLKTPKGFRIYSLGLDSEDDGGKRASEMGPDAAVYEADLVIDYPYSRPSRQESHS